MLYSLSFHLIYFLISSRDIFKGPLKRPQSVCAIITSRVLFSKEIQLPVIQGQSYVSDREKSQTVAASMCVKFILIDYFKTRAREKSGSAVHK